MKKFIALLLALVTALSLVACGSKDNGGSTDGDTVIEVVKNRHGACGQLDFVWVKPFHLFCEVSKHE